MKTKFLLLAAIALGAAACSSSSDEIGEGNKGKNPVVFKANIAERISSRATGTSWANGDKIGITSSDGQFSNSPFTTSGNGNFSGAQGYYSSAGSVSFSAYYPYTASGGTITQTITSATNQSSVDFMYSTTTGSATAPTVTFQFTHRMAQLNLNFIAGTGAPSINGMSATLSGVPVTGSFNSTNGTATSTATGTLSFGGNSSFILFPGTLSGTLSITIGGATYHGNIASTMLESGKSYTINVTINKTAINISTATIVNWGSGSTQNISATM